MMIDTSPWSSCSRRSPWLPCSSQTFSSTGPSVSPFRDFLFLFSSFFFIVMQVYLIFRTMLSYLRESLFFAWQFTERSPHYKLDDDHDDNTQPSPHYVLDDDYHHGHYNTPISYDDDDHD